MVTKNLKEKYIGSSLGIFWALINPVLIMLAIAFVFTQIMKTDSRHFPLLVLSALMPWFFFVNSVTEATASMDKNADLLRQFIMTREIIPISVVLANFLNFLFGFLILIPVFIVFNAETTKYLFLLPLVMFLHFVFTLGISFAFSIGNVYFKDLSQLLNVGMMFLFWLTPVFYTLEMIPKNFQRLIIANPGTCYAVIYRDLLYSGAGGPAYLWLLATLFSFLSIIGGYWLFIKNEREILKLI